MKKGTIIAMIVLVALVAIFFATRHEPQTAVITPFIVEPVVELGRIELTRPSELGLEVVVFEKQQNGVWVLRQPVNAPLARVVGAMIDEAFGVPIRTDNLQFSPDRAAEFGLAKDDAVAVALYSSGSSEPAISLAVGKEVVVETTRVARSFIEANHGKIYRAQRSLDFLRRPVSELRSRSIFLFDRDILSEFVVEGPDGRVRVARSEDGWTAEDVDFELEPSVINGFVKTLSTLEAVGFVDDGNASDFGLDPAQFRVTAKFGDKVVRAFVGRVTGAAYLRTEDPQIFRISELSGDQLTLDPLKIRSRTPHVIDVDDIETIEVFGDTRIVLAKDGHEWKMLRPVRQSVSAQNSAAFVGAVSAFRATRFVNISATDAGLKASRNRVIVRGKQTFELILGDTIPETDDSYAKWQHQDVVFVVPKYLRDRLMPKVSDFETSEP